MEKNSGSGEPSLLRQFGMFGLVLSSFVGMSALGVGLGWYLWKEEGFPWWTILITSGVGLFGASVQVVRYQKLLQSQDKK
jgi:F0F1-type ATP synthase assembly protein I